MLKIKYCLILLVLFSISAGAQFNEFEPEFDWLTIKGKHVYVHFHEEAERTARVVARIADEVWDPITSLYEYDPGVIHYVIKDIDDYSNGATFFFDNKIEIWASALDFDLRGTHNWLRNVISHEFTHMVQIQAGMKVGRSFPAAYIQFLNYQDIRRPDILYGYPDVIVSYPIPSINIPAWFAEGTAQYMRKEFNYDNWDSHRDMILRSYAIDDHMLTWNQMGVFSKTSLGNESVYNSGFALTRYIAQQYGEDKIREVSKKLGKAFNFTIDAAFEDVLGKTGTEIYDEWSNYLKADYNKRIASVKENLVAGNMIAEIGFGNFYPLVSDNNEEIYYISNKSGSYFGSSGIYKYNILTKEDEKIKSNIRSSLGLIQGKNKLVYAKLSEDNPKWVNIHDLYVYDIEEDDETRITFGLRANNPSVSHDGNKIVFIYQKDGTTNLGIIDIDGSNFKRLTFYENGEQVYNPKFSNDDSSILFGYSYHNGRDIAKVQTDGSGLAYILNSDADERNPVMVSDGSIYYANDKTGIFNIYRYDPESESSTRVSNVTGGAFMPAVDDKGALYYAGYTSDGYKIFNLSSEEQSTVKPGNKYVRLDNPPLGLDKPNGDIDNYDIEKLRNFNDYELIETESNPYSGFFSRMSIFPVIRWDNYNISNSGLDRLKFGFYAFSSDYLNRYSLFGGFVINKRFERDAFLIFEYRNKLPLLYDLGLKPQLSLELYSVSRKADADIFFGEYTDSLGNIQYDFKTNTDVTYDLFEFDIAAKHKIFAAGNSLELRFIFSQYTATVGSFIIPNLDILYPTTSDRYFVGNNFQLKYTNKFIQRDINSDINPVGRDIMLQYNYEINDFNDEGQYEIQDGILVPIFTEYNFHRVELIWKEYFSIFKNHTFNTQLRIASIIGPEVPDFFDYYLGGLIGMRAYPFYSIGGNEMAWLHLSYRFPIFQNIESRLGHIYVDKMYFSVFADIGNAWPGPDDFKKGIGAELRLKMHSFYLFPTSLFISGAYAFDSFEAEFRKVLIWYGHTWNFYGGILFDFSLI